MNQEKIEQIKDDLRRSTVKEIVPQEFISIEEGRVEMSMEPQPNQLQSMGTLQGGVVAAILDAAAGYAAFSVVPLDYDIVCQEISIHYLRPSIVTEGTLYCVGEVIKRGRKVVIAEASLYSHDRKKLFSKSIGSYVPLKKENEK